ncbi:hypothetical protein M758_5G125400 [Ceratodon purpureus]|nr:hypothetical protein M758_5G125400 [Ceratodon purpureus]
MSPKAQKPRREARNNKPLKRKTAFLPSGSNVTETPKPTAGLLSKWRKPNRTNSFLKRAPQLQAFTATAGGS